MTAEMETTKTDSEEQHDTVGLNPRLGPPSVAMAAAAPPPPSYTSLQQPSLLGPPPVRNHQRNNGRGGHARAPISPTQPVRPLSSYTNFGSPIVNQQQHQQQHHFHLHGHGPLHNPSLNHNTNVTTSNGPRLRSHSLGAMPMPMGWSNTTSGNPAASPIFGRTARSVPVSPAAGMKPFSMNDNNMTTTSTLSSSSCTSILLQPPPEHNAQHKAREAASIKERQRVKALEEAEASMTADELRAVLKRERHRTAGIAADLAALRSVSVSSQLEAEVMEEGRINNLMRRLDLLQEEKGRIILELEREEEMLTNTLQKKLDQVRREKSVLEQQIINEKQSHAALQGELTGLQTTATSTTTTTTTTPTTYKRDRIALSEALEEQEEMEEED